MIVCCIAHLLTSGTLLHAVFTGILHTEAVPYGRSRLVVIKSQMGQPLCVYQGNKVYWEIPEDLPKTTKLMIDGKALYIHRANFQIIDKKLLD